MLPGFDLKSCAAPRVLVAAWCSFTCEQTVSGSDIWLLSGCLKVLGMKYGDGTLLRCCRSSWDGLQLCRATVDMVECRRVPWFVPALLCVPQFVF